MAKMKLSQQAKRKLSNNVRWHALQLLHKIEHEGEYSNVLIDKFLSQNVLEDGRDQQLLVQLVYGTTQRRLTLDFYLEPFIAGKKIQPWVQTLLRMTVYQLVYLERIPQHAAIHEAVNIAKWNGHEGLGKFVNGVLRHFLRQPLRSFDQCQTLQERLSVQYSIQQWIVTQLLQDLGDVETEALLQSLTERPIVSARMNAPIEEREAIMSALTHEGFEVEASPISPYGIRCLSGNLIHSTLFKEGKLTIQDESSMLVAPIGQIKGTERILDACSAPGGKATHIASLLTDGHLTALDVSAAKLKKVADHMKRLHLEHKVTLYATDAREFVPTASELYDMIYLDAPCSGLGLMRRKPEIKYEKSQADVTALTHIQFQLLEHMATLLKSGGTLIYSTCTLMPHENERMVQQFVTQYPNFTVVPIQESEKVPMSCVTPQGYVKVLPHQFHTDGFFICRLVKE